MPHSKKPLQESLARSGWGHLARELACVLDGAGWSWSWGSSCAPLLREHDKRGRGSACKADGDSSHSFTARWKWAVLVLGCTVGQPIRPPTFRTLMEQQNAER